MAFIQETFTAQRGGINRLRDKGGASKDSLFDLVNAYVTPSGTIKKRPGLTKVATLAAGTIGLFGWKGKLRVFSSAVGSEPNGLFVRTRLRHPSSNTPTLTRVHFSGVFLARLYVVAEFSDGVICHHWLQDPPAWQANTVYKFGRKVKRASGADTGLVFEMAATSDDPSWRPNTIYAVNDLVQPTVWNGFVYKLISRTHDTAASSCVEPTWPTVDGQIVKDRRPVTDLATVAPDPNIVPAPPPLPENQPEPTPDTEGPNRPEPFIGDEFNNPWYGRNRREK